MIDADIYVKNKNWTILYEQSLLVLTAGADKLFAIEDLPEETAQKIIELWKQDDIRIRDQAPDVRAVLEQLVTANILANKTTKKQTHAVAYHFLGDTDAQLSKQIENELGIQHKTVKHANADLLLIIRTNSKLLELTDSPFYAQIAKPHLFIDLGFEHSISLGPLVIPGQSACVSCFIGRLTPYWGDAEPPHKPAIQQSTALIASLVSLEVKKILNTHSRELVNHSVAYDFDNYSVKKSSIYKLPRCPVCSTTTIDNSGAIALPWGKKAQL